MKKLLLMAIVAAIGGAVFYRWQSKPPQPALVGLQTTGLPMKVGVQYWPGIFWIRLAEERGWFVDAGLNVEVVETGADYQQSIQDMVDGKMDGNTLIQYELVKHHLRGAQIAAILLNDISMGGDILIAKGHIESPEDLRGKRIAVSKDSFLSHFLHEILAQKGIRFRDVELRDVKAEEIAPYLEGMVDAMMTFEPHASEAIQKGGGKKIFDSSRVPGLIADLYVFKKAFIKERPGDLQAFVNVWHKATRYIVEHPNDAFAVIAKYYDVPVDEVRAFTEGVKITTLRDNFAAFEYGTDFDSLHGVARKINDFMIKAGITDKQLDSTEFLDPQFIRRLGNR
jgi:NitT/TauT family transport system substrate-binding protein